jgi:proteasome lid subunit RPN8/RPN11
VRVDVDSSLPPVPIAASLVSELLTHAREVQFEECCGLVLGDAQERYRRLVRCQNAMTKLHQEDPGRYPRDGRSAFWIGGAEYAEEEAKAEAAGEQVTAVYHSHLGTGAYLSEMDLEYAPLLPSPGIDQIVISFPSPGEGHFGAPPDDGCVAGLGIFQWDAEAGAFRGRRVRAWAP